MVSAVGSKVRAVQIPNGLPMVLPGFACHQMALEAVELWDCSGLATEPLYAHLASPVSELSCASDLACIRAMLAPRMCENSARARDLQWYGTTPEEADAFNQTGVSLRTLVAVPCIEDVGGEGASCSSLCASSCPASVSGVLLLYTRCRIPQTGSVCLLLHAIGSAAAAAIGLGIAPVAACSSAPRAMPQPSFAPNYSSSPAGGPTTSLSWLLLAAARAMQVDVADYWSIRQFPASDGNESGSSLFMSSEQRLCSSRVHELAQSGVAIDRGLESLGALSSQMARTCLCAGTPMWVHGTNNGVLEGIQLPLETIVGLPLLSHAAGGAAFVMYSLRRLEPPQSLQCFMAQLQLLIAASAASGAELLREASSIMSTASCASTRSAAVSGAPPPTDVEAHRLQMMDAVASAAAAAISGQRHTVLAAERNMLAAERNMSAERNIRASFTPRSADCMTDCVNGHAAGSNASGCFSGSCTTKPSAAPAAGCEAECGASYGAKCAPGCSSALSGSFSPDILAPCGSGRSPTGSLPPLTPATGQEAVLSMEQVLAVLDYLGDKSAEHQAVAADMTCCQGSPTNAASFEVEALGNAAVGDTAAAVGGSASKPSSVSQDMTLPHTISCNPGTASTCGPADHSDLLSGQVDAQLLSSPPRPRDLRASSATSLSSYAPLNATSQSPMQLRLLPSCESVAQEYFPADSCTGSVAQLSFAAQSRAGRPRDEDVEANCAELADVNE